LKQKLQAGNEIDVLTSDEMAALLSPLTEALWLTESFDIVDVETQAQASAGGAFSTEIYTVPVGYIARLNRIEVNAPGATAATPLNTAGAQIGLFVNDPAVVSNQFEAIPQIGTTTIAPSFFREGTDSAKRLQPGTKLFAAGTGLAANQNLYFKFQMRLEPGPRKMHKARS
jgi:hypothetical protein